MACRSAFRHGLRALQQRSRTRVSGSGRVRVAVGLGVGVGAGVAGLDVAKAEPLPEGTVLLVAVGFGISGYLLGLQRATAGAALTDEVTSALSVLDEHFRELDAKDTSDGGVGFDSLSGVNHLELFKWKSNVPPAQVVAARRKIAELATTVPSLGYSSLLSGEALAGRNGSADLAVVAHFESVEDLEAYERSAERVAAIESIRPLLAEPPVTASFGNDVPVLLAAKNGAGAVLLDSGGGGEQVGQADYDAALQVLAAHDGKPAKQTRGSGPAATANAGPPARAPPPPPSVNPPSAQEADAILEAHFAQKTPSR